MTEFGNMSVTFRIKRFNSNGKTESYVQDFQLEAPREMTILDGLLAIKSDIDGSLTFRTSCGHGICGSCAVQVNGICKLACETLVEESLDETGTVSISPLEETNLIKDLVIDDTAFWEKYLSIKPWITQSQRELEKENRVSPADVSKLNNSERCISCGICYASCPILFRNSEFIGPHAILKAFQKVTDVREPEPNNHLAAIETLWNCTTCYQCNYHCPIELTPGTAGSNIRNVLIDDYKIPAILGRALNSVYEKNNPYEMLHEDRTTWHKGLDLPNATEQAVDICYLNCCSTCYDTELQSVAKKMVGLASAAQMSLGVLGEEEKCCGSEVYRLGEMGLFEYMVEERMEMIETIKASQLVFSSPHCFDAYKNQYPDIKIPLMHYTQLLEDLFSNGKIEFSHPIAQKATYHDPCYLGIQNQVFDAPRVILNNIPDLEFVEMEHHRENSICCGGGGGNIWNEIPVNQRVSHLRVQEALDTGADLLVTTCPFCYSELDDAVKILEADNSIKIVDLMELVSMAMGDD
jgi:succinate dehydrogenase/fumarate reductase iron-sulfur protein